MENNRRLLTGDDINIILDEAIRVGMLHTKMVLQ